jgi:hypothetical protein
MLSIAFVVQITVRISFSNCKNGTNSAHALVQSPMMAGRWEVGVLDQAHSQVTHTAMSPVKGSPQTDP